MNLTILSRELATSALRGPHPYTHIISICDIQTMEPVPGFETVPPAGRLFLAFDDVTHNPEGMRLHGYIPPDERVVQKLIGFAGTVPEDAALLVHCEAGISRSTAAAFIVRAVQRGPGEEVPALCDVFAARTQARPNGLMVELADRLLGREGRMLEALQAARQARFEEMYGYATSETVAREVVGPARRRGQT